MLTKQEHINYLVACNTEGKDLEGKVCILAKSDSYEID